MTTSIPKFGGHRGVATVLRMGAGVEVVLLAVDMAKLKAAWVAITGNREVQFDEDVCQTAIIISSKTLEEQPIP